MLSSVPWLLASTALLLPSGVPTSARPQLVRTTALLASEPLSALRSLAANDISAQRPAATGAPDAADAASASGTKYCKYDDIRDQLAASRARSYEQGRNGCCGKAADYLASTGPPPGSPWAREVRNE